ncbi:MAG TPA: cache domain-containing protein [Burkholderiaceae bacterium]
MKHVLRIFSLFLCFQLFHSLAAAQATKGSADEAVAMVHKAIDDIKKNGRDKAFADFSDPNNKQYHDRDLYIFVYDLQGAVLAHGNNPRMVGKNLIDMKDGDGKFIIKGFVDIAQTKGKGWWDYKWPNSVTKAIEQKSAYVEKADGDIIVGSGIYK